MLQISNPVSGGVETFVALLVFATGVFTFYGLLELVRSRVLVRIDLRIDRSLART